MRKTGILIICWASLTMWGGNAAYGDGCSNPTSSYDRTFCAAKKLMQSDQELNEVYKVLMRRIAKDRGLVSKLKEVQNRWIVFRNNSCEAKGEIDLECNYQVNRARIDYLNERIRECKGGACDKEKIFAQPWTK